MIDAFFGDVNEKHCRNDVKLVSVLVFRAYFGYNTRQSDRRRCLSENGKRGLPERMKGM